MENRFDNSLKKREIWKYGLPDLEFRHGNQYLKNQPVQNKEKFENLDLGILNSVIEINDKINRLCKQSKKRGNVKIWTSGS